MPENMEMKERPILFSGPMVQAILDGRKTQTRRIVKYPLLDCTPKHLEYVDAEWKNEPMDIIPDRSDPTNFYCRLCGNGADIGVPGHRGKYALTCPYGKVGDRLYVKETYLNNALDGYPPVYFYKADGAEKPSDRKWKSGRFMPKVAARITLEITGVRVERLQDISNGDAFDEGWEPEPVAQRIEAYLARDWFMKLWDKINGKKHPWASSPWVWVVEFKKI